ncbi:MAG: serine/threonine protein kinase, partial [Cystobacterineae bacterium]|nr:serine/threonine protein kinase [Cystobacterineae bacterium]
MSENNHDEKTHPYVDPYVGITLDGRFRIVHLVGIGGMGRVYRAIQIGLNRAVALKILDPPHSSGVNDSLRQRFLAEASMTAKLHHPNTVTVIDYGATPNGTLYIAFEFLEGRTLAQVLSAESALPWPRVLHIAQQVARSLRQAHSMGVVHRDLKPANIMLLDADSDTDLVKVLDFGLVKAFANHRTLNLGHDVTQAGMLVGSPTYMSPEQGQSSQANPRSDLYALGIVMYECLSGNPPFHGGSPIEVILKHINNPIPSLVLPADFPPLPQAVENLVMRCLAKNPEERPKSMDDFLLETQVLFVTTGKLPPGTSSPYLPNIDALGPVSPSNPLTPSGLPLIASRGSSNTSFPSPPPL